MLRSYTEDWQRKKAYLIRSLFHEIPLLSPVPEESNGSSDGYHPHSDYEVPRRTYSPLPPLIIEREPNKHDEPEEFYVKLEVKIKRIYRKLFIEGKELSNEDYITDIDVSDDFTNEHDYEMIESNNTATRDVRVDRMNLDSSSEDFRNTNGYSADLESNNSDISIDNNNEVKQSSQNLENLQHILETEERNIENAEIINDSAEECTNTDKSFNNHNLPLDKTVSTKDNENSKSSNDDKTNSSDEHQMDVDTQGDEIERQIGEVHEEEENEIGNASPSNEESYENESIEDTDYMQVTTVALVHVDGVAEVVPSTSQVYEEPESIKSYVFPTNADKVDKYKTCVETQTSSVHENAIALSLKELIDPDYMQVSKTALRHVNEAPEMAPTTSPVYEAAESIRSVILPTNTTKLNTAKAVVETQEYRDMDGELINAPLEEQFVPGNSSTPRSQKSNFNATIEEMRSCTNNHNESRNSFHNASQRVSYSLPEPTQERCWSEISEGSEENNLNNSVLSKSSSSDNMNEVLTNILSDSDCRSSQTARKRKQCENISVQTMGISSWDDLRGNFFVGAPKLFRLCSCSYHTCA